LVGQSFSLVTAFPQPEKTPAAFLSTDCCIRNPKVKWFGLERSPNVSHPILSPGLLQFRQDIFAICFKRRDQYDSQEVVTFLREGD
jgi:hypothetical protein